MSISEIGDLLVKAMAGIGFPSLLGKYIYDSVKNRPTRAARRQARLDAQIAAATADDKIRSSSVTSVEAQMVAMAKGFDQERQSKDRTIAFQEGQITTLRAENADKDQVIRELKATVEDLQRQLADVLDRINEQLHDGS